MRKVFFNSVVLVLLSAVVLYTIQELSSESINLKYPESEVLFAGLSIPAPNGSSEVFKNFTLCTLSFGLVGVILGMLNFSYKNIKKYNFFLERKFNSKAYILEEKQEQLIAQNQAYKEALFLIKEQNEEIETAQQDLLLKNKELQEALEEIQSQNELIDRERTKLHQAKGIIQTQNTKLLNIARSLDQQVQERTEELSVSNNLLLEKNKELDDFIYKSAHDLRGPIARFKGLSHLINIEYKVGNDISDHLKHLEQSANQMDSMLKRLSNVYEISARPISLQKMTIDDVLISVFERLKGEESYHHIDIQVNNEVQESMMIDPTLLHLIFKNLIGNSIRFYDPLKLKKWIKIDIQLEDKQLKINVVDNGIGIKKDQQKNIFDLFFVGSELPKGPGLGLYICKIITKKLNGNISLKYSNSEKETSFEATIPL
ncbi:hypothetical protein JKA74_05095 [Marivirga sp. S37H4]|uniref:histidine kinase n=1 Tax=Marivirga aurantiaca TaxID=2802615 RepID=A0A934WWJ6_9BACT|nr:ATP-binding protein [Marivirga aurantiaca]MBK6264404.1 hypothetical protein [Marivirga aurantiaca]